MKFRKLNQAFAYAFGFFWKPCPLCNQEFGGHEWRDTSDRGIIYTSASGGKGICPDWAKSGVALEINRNFQAGLRQKLVWVDKKGEQK